MSKINENKLFNEVIKDMNNCGNYYQFLQLMQSKYNMSENDVKASGLDKVWCKEKHDKPDYYPGEPDPINENAIRKAVRESLEEISWGTVMRAGETADKLSLDIRNLAQKTHELQKEMIDFAFKRGKGQKSYMQVVNKTGFGDVIKMLDTFKHNLVYLGQRKGMQSDNFKTSATDAEEHYLNKNGVIANFDDIQV